MDFGKKKFPKLCVFSVFFSENLFGRFTKLKPTLKNVEAVYGFKYFGIFWAQKCKNVVYSVIFPYGRFSVKFFEAGFEIFEAVYGFNVFQSWLQFLTFSF